MKKSDTKLITLLLISMSLLLLNIFIKNILTENLLIAFLGIIFGTTVFLVGYEHVKLPNKKEVLKFVLIYSMAFLVLLYGIGLFTGFLKTGYSFSFLNIIKNILPVILIIIVSEILRYNLCRKGENNKVILFLTIILFCMVDVSLAQHLYDLKTLMGFLGMTTVILIPSIFKNLLLNDLSKRFGYLPGIIYSLIMGIYMYVIPIVPNLNDYMTSTVMFLIPLMLKIIIDKQYEDREEDLRINKKTKKIFNGVLVVIMIVLIALFSNLFPFWIAAVGSGSMVPTINIGDAIIVDKSVQKHLDRLKEGDVLVFKIKETIYTHRIIEKKENNGKYAFITKGDREGNAVDSWVVTNDDVVGVVKFKISYIGWPTVWLSRLVEG